MSSITSTMRGRPSRGGGATALRIQGGTPDGLSVEAGGSDASSGGGTTDKSAPGPGPVGAATVLGASDASSPTAADGAGVGCVASAGSGVGRRAAAVGVAGALGPDTAGADATTTAGEGGWTVAPAPGSPPNPSPRRSHHPPAAAANALATTPARISARCPQGAAADARRPAILAGGGRSL